MATQWEVIGKVEKFIDNCSAYEESNDRVWVMFDEKCSLEQKHIEKFRKWDFEVEKVEGSAYREGYEDIWSLRVLLRPRSSND